MQQMVTLRKVILRSYSNFINLYDREQVVYGERLIGSIVRIENLDDAILVSAFSIDVSDGFPVLFVQWLLKHLSRWSSVEIILA